MNKSKIWEELGEGERLDERDFPSDYQNVDDEEGEPFTIKETFADVNRSEILFINKWLHIYMNKNDIPLLPKKTIKGEKYPSNQYPSSLYNFAYKLLCYLRRGDSDEFLEKHGLKEDRKPFVSLLMEIE